MTSTRNKNTAGNYSLEQHTIHRTYEHLVDKSYTTPSSSSASVCCPGNGLLPAKMNHSHFSYNGNDIESFLFGIGSTNLHEPADSKNSISVQEKHPSFLNIHALRKEVIFPEKVIIPLHQRPYFSNL